ncbi:MAG: hypothetical protein R3B70_11430 [Polyangiaceae bacterium]
MSELSQEGPLVAAAGAHPLIRAALAVQAVRAGERPFAVVSYENRSAAAAVVFTRNLHHDTRAFDTSRAERPVLARVRACWSSASTSTATLTPSIRTLPSSGPASGSTRSTPWRWWSVSNTFGLKLPDDALGRRVMRTVGKLVDLVLAYEDAAAAAKARAPPPRLEDAPPVGVAPSAENKYPPLDRTPPLDRHSPLDGPPPPQRVWPLVPSSTLPPHEIMALRTGRVEPCARGGLSAGLQRQAFAVLDRVCAGDLFVRDGQVRPTLVLDRQSGHRRYVGQDDEAYLITEGPTAAFLTGHLRAEAPEGADLAIEDLTASHDVISVHGPYA